MSGLEEPLIKRLSQRAEQHLMRQRWVRCTATTVSQAAHIAFNSNDYLGLANHPAVLDAFIQTAKTYGVGSGSSHLINGHTDIHEALEDALATFTGRERALAFSTGYMTNLGVISSLSQNGDCLFHDRLNHASLLDAGQLSRANSYRYQHGQLHSLQQKYARHASMQNNFIISDGVFSMDGDLAPLPELAAFASDNNACLIIDDAHGIGTIGPSGRGIVEHFATSAPAVPVLIGTFGKALGTFGAFVAGSKTLIETCLQFARSYIYTTAIPPAIAAATLRALQLIDEEPERRITLQSRIHYFRDCASSLGLPLSNSYTAIQPLIVGDSQQTMLLAEKLLASGFLVTAIRPPSVPNGSARLRITLSATHSETQISHLCETLTSLMHRSNA